MQTGHLFVLIRIWAGGGVGAPLNRFKPSSGVFLLTVPGRCFIYGYLCYFCLVLLCFHARLFVDAFVRLLGKD